MVRPIALIAAIVVSLLAVSGAGGTAPQMPRQGGTVVVGVQESLEPLCLFVAHDACQGAGFRDVVRQMILQGPFDVTPEFTYSPTLVAGVRVTRHPFTVTEHIRQSARWSDGVPVTASDFVFTFNTNGVDQDDAVRHKIQSVRAIGPRTFKVVFRAGAVFPGWRDLFRANSILPRHVLLGQNLDDVWKDGIDNPHTGEPIGDGPFLVERWDRGSEISLVRNPHYWGSHTAYLDRIVFRFVPDDELADALRRGDIDLVLPVARSLA